jgi:hypothetical protein
MSTASYAETFAAAVRGDGYKTSSKKIRKCEIRSVILITRCQEDSWVSFLQNRFAIYGNKTGAA